MSTDTSTPQTEVPTGETDTVTPPHLTLPPLTKHLIRHYPESRLIIVDDWRGHRYLVFREADCPVNPRGATNMPDTPELEAIPKQRVHLTDTLRERLLGSFPYAIVMVDYIGPIDRINPDDRYIGQGSVFRAAVRIAS